jgi:hypothetical protein
VADAAPGAEIQHLVAGPKERLDALEELSRPAKPREASGAFFRVEDRFKIGHTIFPLMAEGI